MHMDGEELRTSTLSYEWRRLNILPPIEAITVVPVREPEPGVKMSNKEDEMSDEDEIKGGLRVLLELLLSMRVAKPTRLPIVLHVMPSLLPASVLGSRNPQIFFLLFCYLTVVFNGAGVLSQPPCKCYCFKPS